MRIVVCVVAIGCQVSVPRTRSPVDRLADILEHGQSLYGLGPDCNAWRAKPTGAQEGDLDSTIPDDKGLLYGFSYHVKPDHVHMVITGRGGSYPAPGVFIPVEGQPGWGVIGSATYCVVPVDVRPHPQFADAVTVGAETWFLTRAACLQSQTLADKAAGPRDCGDLRRRQADRGVRTDAQY